MIGRRSQSATLRNKASELATEIEQARVSYDHLTAALERVLANETEEARQTEDKLVADLDVERAEAVQELVTAIEKPSRRAVDRACNRLAEIRFRYPEKRRPPHVTPGGVVAPDSLWTPESRTGILEFVCAAGFSHLLDPKSTPRMRFEHQATHDRNQAQRLERERIARGKVAGASIIPDDLPAVPNRQPAMSFR